MHPTQSVVQISVLYDPDFTKYLGIVAARRQLQHLVKRLNFREQAAQAPEGAASEAGARHPLMLRVRVHLQAEELPLSERSMAGYTEKRENILPMRQPSLSLHSAENGTQDVCLAGSAGDFRQEPSYRERASAAALRGHKSVP